MISQASVFVNGRQVKVVKRFGRQTTIVDLRGLPKGTFKVKIVVVTSTGRVLQSTRRYRTCRRRGT